LVARARSGIDTPSSPGTRIVSDTNVLRSCKKNKPRYNERLCKAETRRMIGMSTWSQIQVVQVQYRKLLNKSQQSWGEIRGQHKQRMKRKYYDGPQLNLCCDRDLDQGHISSLQLLQSRTNMMLRLASGVPRGCAQRMNEASHCHIL